MLKSKRTAKHSSPFKNEVGMTGLEPATPATPYLGLDCVTSCGISEIVNLVFVSADTDTIFELTKEILDKI